MQEYLGVAPPDDEKGVVQDIHWSGGAIGYFSTYALRNLDDQIRKGNFSELLAWLRKNIHQHGQKYEPQKLVEMVTGSKITPEPYVRYLTKKYSEIYGL